MKLICIKCPRGCEIDINKDKITGNLCPRGADYAKEELVSPKRIVTALAKIESTVVPVKTSTEIPKELINNVLEEISKLHLKKAHIGDIVIKNCLNTGADIIVTGEKYN